jgi:hypothetical protein
MRRSFAIALLAAAALVVVTAAQQPPATQSPPPAQQPRYLTPEQTARIRELPSVSEEKRVQVDDIDKMLADGKVLFLDVRERKEVEDLGTLEGYVNIPLLELESRLGELPKDKAILTA